MATLAVIPARLAATRLSRKPLRLLAGEPMIVRVWQRIQAMDAADRCVVATDSAEVAAVCREAGAEVVLTSDQHPSGTDRVAEVARMREYRQFTTILNVQGDEPFVPEEAVRSAVSLVSGGSFPLATAAVPGDEHEHASPDVVKVVRSDDGAALYFSRAPIPWCRDRGDAQLHARLVLRHVGVYAYHRNALMEWVALPTHPLELAERLEQLRPLAAGLRMGVAVVRSGAWPGIDTESDLKFANERWSAFTSG